MSTLDELLAAAAAADGMTRINFRDPIAAFGPDAIHRLEPWLGDARLASFAVVTIERVAGQTDQADLAGASLGSARASCDETVRDDIDSALARLGRPARTTSPRASTPAFRR